MRHRLRLLLLSLSASALIAGCASAPEEKPAEADAATSASKTELSRLYEAPNRARISCSSSTPLSVNSPFESIPFTCPELNLTATVVEMYDAGWRIESVSVGRDTRESGVTEMPISITLRKLF